MFRGLSIKFWLLFILTSFLIMSFSLSARPVLTFTIGSSISPSEQSQTLTPLDLCSYTYKPKSPTPNLMLGGFVGADIEKFSSLFRFVAGLGYYQLNNILINGSLTQGADSVSDSIYSYEYRIRSQQVLFEGKWFLRAKENIQPFLMAGIGASFNKVFNYQNNVPPFYEFTPEFSNHTQTNFTYAIGPGVEVSLSKVFRSALAYRFTDLGSANMGNAQIDEIPISSTLKQSHLYANQIVIQFTYTPI